MLAQVVADRLAGDGSARPRCRARRRRPGRRSRGGGRSRPAPRPSAAGAPARMAPMAAAHDSRAPVLPASMCRHSSTESEARRSEAMSSAWPAIIAWVASASRPAARTRSGVGSSRRIWKARVARASPAMMAWPTPCSAHSVGRCRRSRSPSMMSSWTSEKLWTSSMATRADDPGALLGSRRGRRGEHEPGAHELASRRRGARAPRRAARGRAAPRPPPGPGSPAPRPASRHSAAT